MISYFVQLTLTLFPKYFLKLSSCFSVFRGYVSICGHYISAPWCFTTQCALGSNIVASLLCLGCLSSIGSPTDIIEEADLFLLSWIAASWFCFSLDRQGRSAGYMIAQVGWALATLFESPVQTWFLQGKPQSLQVW